MKLIGNDADVESPWFSALVHKQRDTLMHRKTSEVQRVNYGCDADVMMTIASDEIKGLIFEKVDGIYAEQTPAEGQTHIEDIFVNMLQRVNNDAWNRIKTSSAWFPKRIMVELFSPEAAEDVMAQCFEQLSQPDKFMNVGVKKIVCSQLFIPRKARFAKPNENPISVKCCLEKLYADKERDDRNGGPLPRSWSYSDATKTSKISRKREGCQHGWSMNDKRPSRRSPANKIWN